MSGRSKEINYWHLAAGAAAIMLWFVLGLAISRVLYEGLFPKALWLARPLPALISGVIGAICGWLLWRTLTKNLYGTEELLEKGSEPVSLSSDSAAWTAAAIFFPFALNLVYLFDRSVDLANSRFLFFTSLWLTVLFLARLLARPATWRWLSFILLIGFLLPVYLATMGRVVGTADTFEFQVVVPKLGIVHPTGYPLYLLLSKPFTLIPANSVAWRVNLATAVYGLAAVCLLYLLGWRLTKWPLPALIAAAIFGLTPTFWSQAVEAEVYTLHALLVVAALLLMREIGGWQLAATIYDSDVTNQRSTSPDQQIHTPLHPYISTLLLAFILGLGLTNHLTTVILLPAAALTLFFAYRAGRYKQSPIKGIKAILLVIVAFGLPLLLYAYLPIRWAAVNGEPMGLARFVDWVIGGRFQGALQLTAWLEDPTRYDIVGRLFSDEWLTVWTLIVVIVGAAYLLLWQWRYGLILLGTWLGFVFYALNYYVPDLAVFIIPAQLIIAIWWLVGVVAALDLVGAKPRGRRTLLVELIFLLAAIIPLLAITADQTLANVNRSLDEDRTRWAKAVLRLPLDENAAILADSDKFPPLYYLQQAEGFRPDLDIVLLPDEASYRAELDSRLAAGQPVHLARFLPGLEGIYHLNSSGPVISVTSDPITELPHEAILSDLTFGPIQLLGYILEPQSPYSDDDSAVTFYWQTGEPLDEVLHIYIRWISEGFEGPIASQQPANNSYPTIAWEPGEIVADFHSLPRPAGSQPFNLQVALAAPFSQPETLQWQTVTTTRIEPAVKLTQAKPLRMQVGPISLNGALFPEQIRPQDDFRVRLTGYANTPEQLSLALLPSGTDLGSEPVSGVEWQLANPVIAPPHSPLLWSAPLQGDLQPGRYDLVAAYPGLPSNCGWLTRRTAGCVLGQVEISGVPLPEGAVNFGDEIALVTVELPEMALQPGGQLPVNLTWQALTNLDEDYTVFVQVLDENDRIVGQVDSWPVQGTYPTGQWRPGELVEDPYLVRLDEEMPAGQYKLHIGLYPLETLRRLAVLDEAGDIVNDKVEVPGLSVP